MMWPEGEVPAGSRFSHHPRCKDSQDARQPRARPLASPTLRFKHLQVKPENKANLSRGA